MGGVNSAYASPAESHVQSWELTKRVTGTPNFNDSEGTGKDTSPDNQIVRTFDTCDYTLKAVATYGDSTAERKLYFRFKFNPEAAGKAQWILGDMAWMKDQKLSDDGTIVTGMAEFPPDYASVSQGFNGAISVGGLPDGFKLNPTFEVADNPDFNNSKIVEEPLTVTAKLMINIKVRGGNMSGFYYTDPADNKPYRVYTVSTAVQVYNEDGPSYGLKGVAIPEGPITYTLETKLNRVGNGNPNVTSLMRPVLYDYKLNNGTVTGNLGKNMKFKDRSQLSEFLPAAAQTDSVVAIAEKSMGCYDSGTVLVTGEDKSDPNKSVIHVTTDNYGFDPAFKFPKYNYNNTQSYQPEKNEGNFSTQVFQIKIPVLKDLPPTDPNANADFKFTVNALQDISAKTTNAQGETVSVSKQSASPANETVKDDIFNAGFFLIPPGQWDKTSYLAAWNTKWLYNTTHDGQNSRPRGEKFIYYTRLNNKQSVPDNMPRSVNALVKFDGDNLTPVTYKDGKHFKPDDSAGKQGTFEYKMLYGAKKDGSNWANVTEQSRADEKDLVFYDSLDALQAAGKKCVALLFESQNQDPQVYMTPDSFLQVRTYFKVNDDAVPGTVLPFTNVWRGWIEPQDRTTQTRLNPNYVENKPSVVVENYKEDPKTGARTPRDYVPTRYYEDHTVESDHSNVHYGNSLLVLGGYIGVEKELLPHKDGSTSANFNLPAGDLTASWKLKPRYTSAVDTTLKSPISLEEWLPEGLTIIPGSTVCKGATFNDPTLVKTVTITEKMAKDRADRRWNSADVGKVYNVWKWDLGEYAPNTDIPALTFKVDIDPFAENAAAYKNVVTVRSPGNNATRMENNSHNNTIKIINNPVRAISKSAIKDAMEAFDTDGFKIKYINGEETPIAYFNLLDVLPYNNDDRGTKFNGSYQVTSISLEGTNNPENVKVYVSEDPSVRTLKSYETKPSEDSRFTQVTDLTSINKELTAVALEGSINAKSKVYLTVNVDHKDNKGGDVYFNNATAVSLNKANPTLDEIKASASKSFITNTVSYKAVERSVSGLLWLDANANGIQDSDETAHFGNVTVSLVDGEGNVVTGRDGKPASVKTDAAGKYTLGYLPAGDYELRINKDELKASAAALGLDELDLTTLKAGDDTTKDSDAVNAEDGSAYLIKDISLPTLDEVDGVFTINNLDAGYTKLVDITATKTWEGIDKDYPTIYFKLQRQVAGQNAPEDVEGADLKELPDGTTKVVWEGLEKYSPAGKEYTYSVVETDKDGTPTTPTGFFKVEEKLSVINQLDTPPTFEKKIEGEDVYHLLEPDDEFEYSFTSEIPQYVRQFTKFVISDTFDAPFAIQGTPTVEIYKDGALDEELTAAAQSYCSTSGQTAAFTLENNKLVQKFAGTKVVVKVKAKLDFTQDVADYVVAGALPNTAKLQWTNNPKDDLEDSAKLDVSVNIKATKTWEGISKDFPTIYFKLQRATGNNAPEDVPNAEIKELANGATEALWETLPRFSSDGQKYKYSVVEVDKDGNPATPAGFFKVEEELNVINSPDVPPTLEKKVNELDYYHVLDPDEVFEYTFSSTLPEYVRKFTKFELSDTFVNALAIQGTPTVEVLKDGAVDETLTAEAQSYIKVDGQTVSFILDDNAKVKHFAGATFVVHTNAKLNFDQDVASYVEQGAIPNEVTLKWTDNPKDDLKDHAAINVSVDIKATKTWEGITKDFPTIYFKLQRATGDNAPEDVPNAEIKELANGATEATWNTLPRFSSDGKVYKYSVVEVDKEGNPATPAGFFKVEEELNVINSPDVPPTLEKTVNEVKDYQLQDKNETVTYTFSSKLPQYVRKFTKFDLSDTFSDVFMIQSKPKVEVLKGGKVDKELTAEAQKYVGVSGQTVSFVLDSNEKVVPFAGCEIVVSVDAKLNPHVDYKKYEVEGAIPNTVTLKWTNDPKEDLKDSAKIRYPKHHPDVPEKEKEPKPKTPAYTGRIPKTSDGSGLGLIAGITLSASVLGALGLAGLKRKKA